MESYKRFKEFQADMAANRTNLLTQKETLSKQAEIFRNELLAANLMEDEARANKAMDGLKQTNDKLAMLDRHFNQAIESYAEEVFSEGCLEMEKLSTELSDQFDRVLDFRQLYLDEVRKLALIRQKSQSIHNQTTECGPIIRKNALSAIEVRGYHQFEVTNRDLNSIIK